MKSLEMDQVKNSCSLWEHSCEQKPVRYQERHFKPLFKVTDLKRLSHYNWMEA